MGDVAISVPVIRALTDQYPGCKVTILSKPFFKPLFNSIPNVSFYAADVKEQHKGFSGLYRLYRELQKLEITHIADLHDVLRSKILRRFFAMNRTKIVSIDKGRAEKKALTRERNKVFRQLKPSSERYAGVFEKLGFSVDIREPVPVQKPVLSSSVLKITGKKNTSWIGVAPFAAFEGKVYPIHLMKQVIEQLSQHHVKIFLFGGGENEIFLLNEIEEAYENTCNMAGKLSFEAELDAIGNMDVMLSMDSGNAHLAAMQLVNTITVWGVTHPFAGFAPYHQPFDYSIVPDLEKFPKLPCSVYGNKVFKGYENVMESIPPQRIVDRILSVL